MRSWKAPALGVAVTFMGLSAGAENCADGKLDSRFLPARIGYPESALPMPCHAPFDTVEVREGDTCRIFSSVKFHFGEKSDERKTILVRGTLIVEGLAKHPTLFAGSLEASSLGTKPGRALWGGFKVEEGGSLILKNANIHNTAIGIYSRSPAVRLESVWTKGCLSLVGPGDHFIPLEFNGTEIKSLDFANKAPPKRAKARSPDSGSVLAHASGKKRGPFFWGGIGFLAAGTLGAAWLFLAEDDTPVSPQGREWPADLAPPGEPGPRKP